MFKPSRILHPSPFAAQAKRQAAGSGRTLLMLLVLGFLGACDGIPERRTDSDDRYIQTRAQRLEQAGRHAQAAELYEQIAERSDGDPRFWLKAAGQWHTAGEWQNVERALNRIDTPLSDAQALQRALLGASAALNLEAPARARAWLTGAPPETPDRARPALMWLEVRLAVASGDLRRAIALSNEREMWLSRADDIRTARRALLAAIADETLLAKADPAEPDETEYSGWLDLGKIQAGGDRDPFVVRSSLRDWRENYPEHPADVLLPELLAEYKQLLDYPQRLAVLLPLSGRFAAAGQAVRDGMLAAYLRQDESRPRLRFFDTGKENVVAAYARAAGEDTDFVIGPLTRNALDELAASSPLPLPTLALNNLSAEAAQPGLYQFGLTPEDEARQSAQRLLANGLVQGIALVPATDWGTRMLTAFSEELESAGGMLLDYQEYAPRDDDFSGPITTVLHLAESRARYRSLSGVLGRRLEFEPRRREDVQFIFLAATPEAGRLMRPQLRFHYASDLPVFATSAIYEPDPSRNRDLNGIQFIDIPWLIDGAADAARLREQLETLFPRRMQSWPRLYALGYDAYRLVPALFSGRLSEEDEIKGLTGDLTMSRDGQLKRKMRWAQFSNGMPILIEDAEPSAGIELPEQL